MPWLAQAPKAITTGGSCGVKTGARQVVEAHRVPQHDVGVFDWAPLGGIGREAVAAVALVRVRAGGVQLARVVSGDPERRGREGGAALRKIVGGEQRCRGMAQAQ